MGAKTTQPPHYGAPTIGTGPGEAGAGLRGDWEAHGDSLVYDLGNTPL